MERFYKLIITPSSSVSYYDWYVYLQGNYSSSHKSPVDFPKIWGYEDFSIRIFPFYRFVENWVASKETFLKEDLTSAEPLTISRLWWDIYLWKFLEGPFNSYFDKLFEGIEKFEELYPKSNLKWLFLTTFSSFVEFMGHMNLLNPRDSRVKELVNSKNKLPWRDRVFVEAFVDYLNKMHDISNYLSPEKILSRDRDHLVLSNLFANYAEPGSPWEIDVFSFLKWTDINEDEILILAPITPTALQIAVFEKLKKILPGAKVIEPADVFEVRKGMKNVFLDYIKTILGRRDFGNKLGVGGINGFIAPVDESFEVVKGILNTIEEKNGIPLIVCENDSIREILGFILEYFGIEPYVERTFGETEEFRFIWSLLKFVRYLRLKSLGEILSSDFLDEKYVPDKACKAHVLKWLFSNNDVVKISSFADLRKVLDSMFSFIAKRKLCPGDRLKITKERLEEFLKFVESIRKSKDLKSALDSILRVSRLYKDEGSVIYYIRENYIDEFPEGLFGSIESEGSESDFWHNLAGVLSILGKKKWVSRKNAVVAMVNYQQAYALISILGSEIPSVFFVGENSLMDKIPPSKVPLFVEELLSLPGSMDFYYASLLEKVYVLGKALKETKSVWISWSQFSAEPDMKELGPSVLLRLISNPQDLESSDSIRKADFGSQGWLGSGFRS